MKVSAPVYVEATRKRAPLRGEVTLRYAAAYACTLIATMAAQLYSPPGLVFFLGAVVLAGWPLSMAMRARMLPEGVDLANGRILSRFAINSSVVILSSIAALALIGLTLGGFGGAFGRLIGTDARTVFGLMMECFLIFACFRCLAILNDKDAALSTLPTYAVLLLLMVVLNGANEVVLYFFAWMAVAAALLALDHRAESRNDATGVVPAIVPGQDVSMSARGLGTIVALSSLCAVVLSSLLSNDSPTNRSPGDGMIAALASRLSTLQLSLPDVSVNAGPERQIDFTTGPTLPTRAELWVVDAFDADTERRVNPAYWRMFTYGQYDGHSWSQVGGQGTRGTPEILSRDKWPLFRQEGIGGRRYNDFLRPRSYREGLNEGYDVSALTPDRGGPSVQFGRGTAQNPTMRIIQSITARAENVGYIPTLPSPRSVIPPEPAASQNPQVARAEGDDNALLRVRNDYAVDLGVVRNRDKAFLWSEVSSPEYGNERLKVPTKTTEQPNPQARLSAREAALYTALPSTTTASGRIKVLVTRVLRGAGRQDNNYAKARLLLNEVQSGATYTLRPPIPPENRDASEYFLFEGDKRGYCTYFAGALTVLCRQAGIPARVVTGFVSPEQLDNGPSLIRESMSHAWTEVWVPGWGWATLDATPASDRGNNAPGIWDSALAFLGSVLEESRTLFNTYRWPILGLGGLLVLGAISLLSTRIVQYFASLEEYLPSWWVGRSSRLSPDDLARADVMRLYKRTTRRLGQNYRLRAGWETPAEWLRGAETELALPDWGPLQQLTDLYARARYSPAPISPGEVANLRERLAKFTWKPPAAKA